MARLLFDRLWQETRVERWMEGMNRDGGLSNTFVQSSRRASLVVVAILSATACLLAWQAWRDAPTYDEPAHLLAGISYWKTGRFGIYRVNPPLPRLIGSLPVILLSPEILPIPDIFPSRSRPEFGLAERFIRANGAKSVLFILVARLALIPMVLLGGYVAYRWARELYGFPAGLCALLLWCASPDILAHGHLMTPDTTAASFGLLSCYCFYRWLKRPTFGNACWTGVSWGLALLSKSTWILLIPIFLCLYGIFAADRRAKSFARPYSRWAQLAIIYVVGIYVLNVGYGFEGSFRPLGSFEFVTPILTGRADERPGNRFAESLASYVPVPFPANFVEGIDQQKTGMDRGESYLRDEWKKGGWWYFYIYCLAVKIPIGVWLLACLTVATIVLRRDSRNRRAELVLLLPAAVILITASMPTGIYCLRYVLPVLPALFVWSSQAMVSRIAAFRKLAAFACTWVVCSSLWIYPHTLSYFNELVGGPINGHRHLLDSSMDWGQDLFYCSRLLQSENFSREQPQLAYYGFVHPAELGMSFKYPQFDNANISNWPPGVYAISVNFLQGKRTMPVMAGDNRRVPINRDTFSEFRDKVPIAMAGYTIRIYRITD